MSKHSAEDKYMLQVLLEDHWHDVESVGKMGAIKRARAAANRTKKRYRVINLSKNKEVYVDCDPR
jgi:hypothetical protein